MTTPHATTRTVRALQLGQHLLGALLLVVCTLRALRTGAAPLATLGVAAALVLVYGVGTYLARRRSGSRPALLWLLALTLLWACALIVSAEFSWFAFVLWFLGGHLLGAATGVGYALVVLAAAIAAPVLHDQQIDTAAVVGPTVGALFAWGLARGQVQLVRDMEERERLTAALAEAERQDGVDAERTRVSREVHDTLAQGFSSIVLLARAGGPDALARIETTAADNLAEARRLVAALAPPALDDAGLAPALRRLGAQLATDTGATVEVHADDLPLPTTIEVALLRAAQSLLANVRRHASATRVGVTLAALDDEVRLDIVDDGRGFDPGATGFGLTALRARLAELGGGLDVESALGEGTAVSAHVPWPEGSAA